MIMLIPLQNNDSSFSFNLTFAIQSVNFRTFPKDCIFLLLSCVCFTVFEAILILNNLRIVGTNETIEGFIDQDFVFSQNNVFNIPILNFCKNNWILQNLFIET